MGIACCALQTSKKLASRPIAEDISWEHPSDYLPQIWNKAGRKEKWRQAAAVQKGPVRWYGFAQSVRTSNGSNLIEVTGFICKFGNAGSRVPLLVTLPPFSFAHRPRRKLRTKWTLWAKPQQISRTLPTLRQKQRKLLTPQPRIRAGGTIILQRGWRWRPYQCLGDSMRRVSGTDSRVV